MKGLIVSLKFSNFLQLQEEQSLGTGMPHALLPFIRGNYEFRKPRWYVKLEAMFHKCLVIAALFQSWTLLRPRKTPFPFRGVDYIPSHLGSLRDPNCTMPEERSEDLVNNLAHFLRQNENATPVNSSPEYWTTLIWWAEAYQHRKAVC